MNRNALKFWVLSFVVCLAAHTALAQSTEFTYQGRLLFGGMPANGNHDFEFRLFSDADGNSQVGVAIPLTAVNVNNGVFSVRLDFGNQFPGANRYLEIRVKQSGAEFYTILTPRQAITSSPYAVKSLNAENATNAGQLGGVEANQFVLTNDRRMSDARHPLPDSPNYIQNAATLQTGSNFNISGNGTAGGTLSGNVVSATTQFNIGNNRVLSFAASGTSLHAGLDAGAVSAAAANTFVGQRAGFSNTTGTVNAFFGALAGSSNTTGGANSFFGHGAGQSNTTSLGNSFFGSSSGALSTGGFNSFFGASAGVTNTTGSNNTLLGSNADVLVNNLTNAAALGFRAGVSQSNSLVLGSINGVNGATADTKVGIGTTAPTAKLSVFGNGAFNATNAARFDLFNTTANIGYLQHVGNDGSWQLATTAGETRIFVDSLGVVSGIKALIVDTKFKVGTLGVSGATSLCRNAANEIATCSSSLRYKANVKPFSSGLNLIKRLRPVSFTWKADNTLDFGLAAEEVAEAEPLLVTKNDKGEVEGVKYDRVGVVLVNAVQEQQAQIEAQRKEIDEQKAVIKRQQAELDALKKLVCSQNPTAEICQPKN
jgi:hypothetical protein